MGAYVRFVLMILVSTLVMFVLMYLNTYALDHVFFSQTRAWMALYMGAAMAIVMLLFMLGMYQDRRKNIAILVGAGAVFTLSLFLVRSQETVSDHSWQKAMIPHHSIAILTSSRARIEDVRVRDLAERIVQAQRREIQEMRWLLNDIERNGKARTAAEALSRPVPASAEGRGHE
jgi:hypothetical protein